MSLNFRRFLYILAILIFLVTAPALILYTAGYRYDFSKNRVQSTGSIFIKTLPADSKVYLNNKLIAQATPLRLNHLLPNIYDLRIELDGYQAWSKKLEVSTGRTTFIDQVILWPQNPINEKIISKKNIQTFSINNNETKIAWQSDRELYIYNSLNQESEKILTLPTTDKLSYNWSPNFSKLIVEQNKTYWLVSLDNKLSVEKFNTIDSQAQTIKFHPELPDVIIFLKNNQLYSYNLITRETKKILDKKIQDYRWHNGNWYYLTLNSPIILTYTNLQNNKHTPPLFQLPEYFDYSFIDIINDQALIYQPETLTLYVFNLNPAQFNNTSQIIKPVKNWQINPAKNKLVLNNDWEIWMFDLNSSKSEIINRVSNQIKNSSWYINNNYVLIQYENSLEIVETDSRDRRNQAQLWTSPLILQNKISTNGESIYILSQTDQEHTELIKIIIAKFPLLKL